jgi:hypothetical protein
MVRQLVRQSDSGRARPKRLRRGRVEAPIGDLVNRLSVRSARVVADAESDGPQNHRAIRMVHSNEHRAKTAIGPRDVGLNASAEVGSIPPFGLAGHQPRPWDTSRATNLLAKRSQRNLGARRKTVEILDQGVVVKADREDRLGPGFGPGQPSSSAGNDPKWSSNSSGSSRCSP